MSLETYFNILNARKGDQKLSYWTILSAADMSQSAWEISLV